MFSTAARVSVIEMLNELIRHCPCLQEALSSRSLRIQRHLFTCEAEVVGTPKRGVMWVSGAPQCPIDRRSHFGWALEDE